MVTLDERYQALASLQLELRDIRNRENIIAYEKTVKIASNENPSQETINSLKKEIEDRKDGLSAVYKAAQPVISVTCTTNWNQRRSLLRLYMTNILPV